MRLTSPEGRWENWRELHTDPEAGPLHLVRVRAPARGRQGGGVIFFPFLSGVGLLIIGLCYLADGEATTGIFIGLGALWAFACALDPARTQAARRTDMSRILSVSDLSDRPRDRCH